MNYLIKLTVVVGLLFLSFAAAAQNMNSPYSIYGIGDIDFRPYNRTSGMGGAGVARLSSFYIIDNNPAALSGLTRSFYVVDAATTAKSVTYRGAPITADNSNSKDFWIKRLSFSVKLNNHWASGFGFGQFSSVNYKFFGSKSVEGTANNYLTYYEGDGGLNEYYWTNAVSLGKHLSLGLKSSIIAGPINQTETIIDAGVASPIATKVQDYMGKARLQAGAIYGTALGKKWDLSLGLKYSPSMKMAADRTVTVSQGETILSEESISKSDRFSLPQSFTAGISLRSNKKTSYAVDYTHEDWSSLKIRGNGWQLINSDRIAAGIEFSKQATMWNQTLERRYFQLGAFVNNSYLQIRNQPIREFGVTAGMGGYLGQNLLYTLALEAGQRGTTSQQLIRENYVQFTLSFSYRDFLRSKGRKYD